MLSRACRSEAAPFGGELLPPGDGDETGGSAPRAREGRRCRAAVVSLVAVMLVGALLILCLAPSGWLELGKLFKGNADSVDVLRHSIKAVVIDVARSRRTEAPVLTHSAGLPKRSGATPDSAPRPVRWGLLMRQMEEAEDLLDTQKFRLLNHSDSLITLLDRHGLHLDATDNITTVVGGVTTGGVLVTIPIEETGRFVLEYNFDNSVTLRHSNGDCLTANDQGEIYMADCDLEKGAWSIFTPTVLETEGTVAFQLGTTGRYLTVFETWVQDYRTSVVMVNKTVAERSPSSCSTFYRAPQPGGLVALETARASYLTATGSEDLGADVTTVGPNQLFVEVGNADGSTSLAPADPGRILRGRTLRGGAHAARNHQRHLGYLELQGDGRVRATGESTDSAGALTIENNSDGSVSLTRDGKVVCAAERTVKVLTCETRKVGPRSWPMQGVSVTMEIENVCFGLEWYGFKTKVDAYREYVQKMARGGQPDQIVVLVDNSDMAFGGCTYDEMLYRYDLIARLTGAPVIAGADNAPYPTSDWPYDTLEDRRAQVMQAFGMGADQYCDNTECPRFFYKFANSGFLMGPPSDLDSLLGCMQESGWGKFGKTGYDDQQGLQACMFGDNSSLVALDYSGTLSMQLIRMNEWTLYEGSGKVYNSVARGMSQCFVHGNGDTMEWWWPRLFPGLDNSEDYGKAFMV